jgi:hypothetical protein
MIKVRELTFDNKVMRSQNKETKKTKEINIYKQKK